MTPISVRKLPRKVALFPPVPTTYQPLFSPLLLKETAQFQPRSFLAVIDFVSPKNRINPFHAKFGWREGRRRRFDKFIQVQSRCWRMRIFVVDRNLPDSTTMHFARIKGTEDGAEVTNNLTGANSNGGEELGLLLNCANIGKCTFAHSYRHCNICNDRTIIFCHEDYQD